jgi:SAM-dependent methyltransferase
MQAKCRERAPHMGFELLKPAGQRESTAMKSPWLDIPLADYEAHMSSPTVGQAAMLAEELSKALGQFAPESVAIIGCAGGNGFGAAFPRETKRVVGVDINPDYISTAASRFQDRIAGLELYVADIQEGPLPFDPVDLVYAGLVFEYVLPNAALGNLARACRPGGHLVAVLQQPSARVNAVSPSPYTSLRKLEPVMRLIVPADLEDCAASQGFVLTSEATHALDSGKRFAIQTYRRDRARSQAGESL